MRKLSFFAAYTTLGVLTILTVFYSALGFGTGLEQDVQNILVGPSSAHWFGTDSLGRDLFARVFSGGRISLLVGIVCSGLTFAFGVTYGVIAGWFEGWTDRSLMRICDILSAIPSFVLVSILCLSLNLWLPIEETYLKSLIGLCLGISATHWMNLARVTRAKVLEIKRKPFVEAAISLGGSQTHILYRHILPNMMGTLMILVAMQIPNNILYESFMSFIGLGIQPPHTSWGILVREGWKTLSSFPHLILFPSLVLFLTVWSFQIILDVESKK